MHDFEKRQCSSTLVIPSSFERQIGAEHITQV